MANLYKTIPVKRNRLSKIIYYVNAVYPEIESSSEDLYITTSYEDRLDLLAYDYYGDETLWWIISRANPDITRRDSFFIKLGVQIRIPDPNTTDFLIEEFEQLNATR
tara:strand:- start:1141 stop:1461 length:321 start_codon:yes stop_codon:yes gene_type:complete